MTRNDMTGSARALRKRQTSPELKLWNAVRNRQIDGWKFRRQVGIGNYVVDFGCAEAMLIVELDGIQHLDERAEYDRNRTAFLEREGFHVVRFWNVDVTKNLEAVLGTIWRAIQEQAVEYRIPRPLHRYDASRSRHAIEPNKPIAPSPQPSPRRGSAGGASGER